MFIPKRVKVGPYWWAIEFVDDMTDPADRNTRVFGQCREGDLKILINKSLDSGNHFQTFLHELTHAIDFTLRIGLKENQADRLATGLAMVLQDNSFWEEECKPFMCGIVSMSGLHGEPLACAYPPGHEGDHSWGTLPTFAKGSTDAS